MNELQLTNLCYLGPLDHITLDHSHEGWHAKRYEEYFAEHPEFKKWNKVIVLTGNYALDGLKSSQGYIYVPFNCWLHYVPRMLPRGNLPTFEAATHCFLAMVWTPRPDKVVIYARFIQEKLFDQFILSMRAPTSVPFDYKLMDKHAATLQTSSASLTALMDKLPLQLDLGQSLNSGHIVHATLGMDTQWYTRTHLSVVMETEFIVHGINRITEKTFKAIAYGHAFLIIGAPFCTRLLQQLGFRTFHPYINESFDCVLDHDNRLNMIMVELKRLSQFSAAEWSEFHQQTRDIVTFNQALLYDTNMLQKNINDTEGRVKSLY
jgi:hypothetical protein